MGDSREGSAGLLERKALSRAGKLSADLPEEKTRAPASDRAPHTSKNKNTPACGLALTSRPPSFAAFDSGTPIRLRNVSRTAALAPTRARQAFASCASTSALDLIPGATLHRHTCRAFTQVGSVTARA